MKRIIFIFCLLLLLSTSVFSIDMDYGVILNQYADNGFSYHADIIPRFLLSFGDNQNGSFIVSAGFTAGYDEELFYVPELLRTELSLRFGALQLKAGRFLYSDPLTFIAEGLFDGAQISYSSSLGRFSISGMYTGLLYKKNADITMTAEESALYASIIDYNDFTNTYFAPRRLIGSFDWEHNALGELLRIKTAFIVQADLNNNEEKYNSEYFVLKLEMPFKNIWFEAGGSLQAAQFEMPDNDDSSKLGLAGMLGVHWTLPVNIVSRLSFTAKFATGDTESALGAFSPITNKYYSDVFQMRLSNLAIFRLDYSARLMESLGMRISTSTFLQPAKHSEDDYSLGTEVYGRLIWSPVSDLQLNLGGGVHYHKEADWKIELSAILAIY